MGKNNMRAEFKPIIIENLVRPVPSSTQQQIQTITSVSGKLGFKYKRTVLSNLYVRY